MGKHMQTKEENIDAVRNSQTGSSREEVDEICGKGVEAFGSDREY